MIAEIEMIQKEILKQWLIEISKLDLQKDKSLILKLVSWLAQYYNIKPLDHKNTVIIELQDAKSFDDLDRLSVFLFDQGKQPNLSHSLDLPPVQQFSSSSGYDNEVIYTLAIYDLLEETNYVTFFSIILNKRISQ